MRVRGEDWWLSAKELRKLRGLLVRIRDNPREDAARRGAASAWSFIVDETIAAADNAKLWRGK